MKVPPVLAVLVAVVVSACASAEEPEQNHAPFLVTSDPVEGNIVTIPSPDSRREVALTVADENVGDHLFVRFLLDYPGPDSRALSFLELPPSGTAVRGTVRILPSCAVVTRAGTHRLTASISDRPFLDPAQGEDVDPEAPLDSIAFGAAGLRVVWLLEMACP
jgi:hypothetical protein